MLQLLQHADASSEIGEPYGRRAEHGGFDCHTLAIADIEVGEVQGVVNVSGIQNQSMRFQVRLERTFGGDVDPSMRREVANQNSQQFAIDPPNVPVMVCI